MSFDIFFQPCRYGGTTVEKKNPFTGQVQSSLVDEPLNAAESTAVRNVLSQAGVHGPDEYGCYRVDLEDGGNAEVFASNLEWGCSVAARSMTPSLCQFLYRLLKAGNWVMLPVMEEAMAITTSPGSLKRIPDDFPKVVVCNSIEELTVLLADGFGAWEKYRDQLVDGGP
jgi:hypothetical protein